MKFQLVCASALIAAAATSLGYTTATTNGGALGDPDLPIVDNTGTPIPIGGGSIAVGYFDTLTDVQIAGAEDFGALLADWVQFGTASANGFQNAFSVEGVFDFSTNAPIPNGGNNFTNRPIYTVIGNAATIPGSSQLAVWKSNTNFGQENAVGLGSAASPVQSGQGELIFGDPGAAQSGLGGFANYTNSIQLSLPVPEPSSALLVGLCGIGFVLRRKR